MTSVPTGAAIVLDGQVAGTTPATITTTAGQSVVLRRSSAPDVVVLDPQTTDHWLATRAPTPGHSEPPPPMSRRQGLRLNPAHVSSSLISSWARKRTIGAVPV